jgi:hypothetical protein
MFQKLTLCLTAFIVFLALPGAAEAQRSPAPKNANIYIIWPSDGQVISGGKFWVRFGSRNVGIAPAGVEFKNTGHHHLVIDAELPPMDEPVPFDKNHMHFGAGQTEARLELPPGKHTIQMLLADHEHMPHDPPVASKRITIIVPE